MSRRPIAHDNLPEALRVQIVHILEDVTGLGFGLWSHIAKAIAKEHGLLNLPGKPDRYGRHDPVADCLNYVLQAETPKALSMIELCFRKLDGVRDYPRSFLLVGDPDDAIEELNQRFRQHGVGYQYESGIIVRVDSLLLHTAAVVPALTLLRTKGFEGPNKEFLSAHEHFRHGRIEEAVTDACKALLLGATERVTLTDDDEKRAEELRALGFHALDALHLACAERAGVDAFLTTDDRLLKVAGRSAAQVRVAVCNPLQWILTEPSP